MLNPSPWAAERDWLLGDCTANSHPASGAAWDFSRRQLHEMRRLLHNAQLPRCISVVAAAGSLGRMEGSPASDADLIVLLDPQTDPASRSGQAAYDAVWQALEPLALTRPLPDGIYGSAIRGRDLVDPADLGKVDQDLQRYGLRFQFLLEAQSVFGIDAHDTLVAEIVQYFARDFVAVSPSKEWTCLLNELVRYFRSLCLTYQWDSLRDDPGRWRMRNIKARHSRLLQYAGLLFLLGEASREQVDKINWLIPRIRLTPLERIAHVYAAHRDPHFATIATAYERFMQFLSDPQSRAAVAERTPSSSSLEREEEPLYQELKGNSDALLAELLRFVLARRGDWSERFFQYLIF